jgi:hypothetical protein
VALVETPHRVDEGHFSPHDPAKHMARFCPCASLRRAGDNMRGITTHDLDRVSEKPHQQHRHIGEDILGDYYEEITLATQLGVTTRTLRRWHNERIGPARTTFGGRKILYRKEAVIQWLLEREQRPLQRKARRNAARIAGKAGNEISDQVARQEARPQECPR